MKKITKILSMALSLTMSVGVFAGCAKADDSKGKVYFLNFKPEVADVYKEIAEIYTKETGIEVKVSTAAGGNYEQTLKSEIAKSDAPTIFQMNGPVGYASWKDYTEKLTDTTLYEQLIDKNLAIRDGEDVYGIPFAIEGYGIIYNKAILDKYFALDDSKAKTIEEINNFEKLKEVTEDMQAKKETLGIEGVFASTSLVPGHEWRWHTHLANIPLYYEFKDTNADLSNAAATSNINFTYSNNFKNLFDLYINNSVTDRKLLGTKSVDDSMAEFALGKVAMVQNGNWAWGQISSVSGNTVKEEDIKFMPMYTGTANDEKQGLSIGTENFFAINKNARDIDKQASIDFLTWLYTSEVGKKFVTEKLGFIAPFSSFTDAEKPTDPLAKETLRWSENPEVENLPWNFTIFPSQVWKDNFGSYILRYAQGTEKWEDLVETVVKDWSVEKQNSVS